ncbi:MAG: glycosyltransferase [Coriobacteriia bacterium]|nr:glycosyltransferase [Coriobacteriia bacterium]
MAVVTDAPFYRDLRARRTVDALARIGADVSVIDQGFEVDKSRVVLEKEYRLYSGAVPPSKSGRFIWHLKNRVLPLRAYDERSQHIYEVLLAENPTVIHCINVFALEPCAKAAEKLDARLVYEAYEYWPEHLHSKTTSIPSSLAEHLEKAEKEIAPTVDAFITVSKPFGDWYRRYLDVVDPAIIFNVNAPDSHSEGVVNNDKNYCLRVVHSGNLFVNRKIEQALYALDETDDFCLAIQGDGPQKSRLKAIAKKNGCSDRVEFIDSVPAEKLIDSLQEFQIGLQLHSPDSMQTDGTVANKIFDYLRAGLAVIAVDTSGMQSLDRIDEFALLIEEATPSAIAQAVDELSSDRGRLSSMRRSALREGARYSREAQMLKIQKIYEGLDAS